MSLSQEIKAAKELLASLTSKIISRTFAGKLTAKIGEKGTVNIYGLQRMPFCFYPSQIAKLQVLFESAEFKQFMIENKETLEQRGAESKAAKAAATQE